MSLLVTGLRLPFDAPDAQALALAMRQCGLREGTPALYRRSIDARHGKIYKVCSVLIDGVPEEKAFAEHLQMPSVRYKSDAVFAPVYGSKPLRCRPVVAGLGPAGLFCAYLLAEHGYRPVVLERGGALQQRDAAVRRFWSEGTLDPECNIQFGEGGAGTYSDGKLTTRINDPLCETVLRLLHQNGAPDEILRLAKPHIGTDLLKGVVSAMRRQIERQGGTVHFWTPLTGLVVRQGQLEAVLADGQPLACERAVLAIGHSARDTFQMLYESGIALQPKPFSVGVRIEHAQQAIDRALYGRLAGHAALPPAEYALSHREGGRACYSFCMCPGGAVVAAASEAGGVVTNGMSCHARNGPNANAALAVSVGPEDFEDRTPLGGIAFQRAIERAAYAQTGGFHAPCQTVGDFLRGVPSTGPGGVRPTYTAGVAFGEISPVFPAFITDMLRGSLPVFGRKIRGFDGADALLTAPETRTSSPVRISRNEALSSVSAAGLIPCGEGAGFAGGIMSAAVDGLRAALCIMKEFAPF